MKLEQPFVRLPWQFDAERLATELSALDSAPWMPHPSGMAGNDALPLVSRHAENNNDFDGVMAPTKYLDQSPYMQQVLGAVGEVYGRSRLMRLAAGAQVSQHVDFNYHWYSRVRIHVPIITNEQVVFHCGDEAIHMAAGECWIFDSWRHHKVVNDSDIVRTHLVFDTSGSSGFWQTVNKMIAISKDDPEKLNREIATIPFDSSAKTTLRTERFNSAPVMAPGEMAALVDDLLEDVATHGDNSAQIVKRYHQLLHDLVHDWRELWHLHGYQRQGWPQYEQLLERTVKQLDPNPRVLVTSSNQIGINPIIMQRIIRAALRFNDAERFLAI